MSICLFKNTNELTSKQDHKYSTYTMLTDNEFNNLCHLARLNPNDPSLEDIHQDFNKILDYVETIQKIDTKDGSTSSAVAKN